MSGAAIRFTVLCAAIAGVEMLSPRLTPHQAGVTALVGVITIVLGGAALAIATRVIAEIADRQHQLEGRQRILGSLLTLLRATGLPLLGLAFMLVWSFVYLSMWWFAPKAGGAFAGLGDTPRFADFFYYSVQTALISPPGDIIATSRGARAATMIEMLTGLALVTAYLGSFAAERRLGGQSHGGASADR